jgi:hypothetical protein
LLPQLVDTHKPKEITLEDLKKTVQTIGKLKFKRDVPVTYLSRSRLRDHIKARFDRDYSAEQARKESLFLQLMGFTANRVDLLKLRKKTVMAKTAATYRYDTGDLLALKEDRRINEVNSLTLVHELRHAIQDQHINLKRALPSISDFDDRRLAPMCALEGDAVFLTILFSGSNPELLSQVGSSNTLLSFSSQASFAKTYRLPPVVKYQLIMPYVQGMVFVTEVYTRKKWKGVNRLLNALPRSTEQIMHPEKYRKKEEPEQVLIAYKPEGFKQVHSGVLGEYYLNVLLKAKEDAFTMAIGWGGDTFELFENDRHVCLLWESLWDKEKYCSRFFFDFKRFVEKSFDINFRAGRQGNKSFLAGHSSLGYFFLYRQKNRLFYVRTTDRNQINAFINGGQYD